MLFLPKSTIYTYENDKVDMKMGTIKKLTNILDIGAGYLLMEREKNMMQRLCK